MRRILAALLLTLWTSVASAGVTCTLPFNLLNGTTADATQVMANYNAITTCLGQAAAAGVNADITNLTALSVPLTPVQGGSSVYTGGTSTGSANAQVVASPTPINFTKAAGKRLTFTAGFTNTGSTTLNVNASGAANIVIYTPSGAATLAGGEIIAGNYVEVIYDGTFYVLYTNAAVDGGYGSLTALASASTTDLGTIPSHNILITGSTTIGSFGSTATTFYPVYKLVFQTSLTITASANLTTVGNADILTQSGDTATVLHNSASSWIMLDYTRKSGTAVINPSPMSGAQGLIINNDAGTPNTNININLDQAVMINPTGNVPLYAGTTSVLVNCTTVGAGGLDVGSLIAGTWYYVYLISTGGTTVGLVSSSPTAPIMPTGYIYRVRLGAMRTDGSANFLRTRQQGSHAEYINGAVTMITGSNTAWTAIAVGAFVPPTATQIKGVMSGVLMGNNTTVSVAPSNGYPTGSIGSATTTPLSITNATGAANGISFSGIFEFNLQSTNIYYGSNSGGAATIATMGWTDKVNAN